MHVTNRKERCRQWFQTDNDSKKSLILQTVTLRIVKQKLICVQIIPRVPKSIVQVPIQPDHRLENNSLKKS